MSIVITYVATLLAFAGIDFVWLGFIAHGYYRSQIGHLLATDFNLVAAAAFYLVYVVGLMVFAVMPAIASGGVMRGLVLGAMFGFFCYATYDLTNLTTLKNWSLPLSLVDMAWGSLVSGIAAAFGTWVAGRL